MVSRRNEVHYVISDLSNLESRDILLKTLYFHNSSGFRFTLNLQNKYFYVGGVAEQLTAKIPLNLK